MPGPRQQQIGSNTLLNSHIFRGGGGVHCPWGGVVGGGVARETGLGVRKEKKECRGKKGEWRTCRDEDYM